MVRGRCHLNVSAIIKKLPNDRDMVVVALRNKVNFEKVALKKFTQFPFFLDDVVRPSFPKRRGPFTRHFVFRSFPVPSSTSS